MLESAVLITAVASAMAAIIAAAAFRSQSRHATRMIEMEMLDRMMTKFDSDSMLEDRLAIASRFASGESAGATEPFLASQTDLLNFFEIVGLMLSRKVFDIELLWTVFYDPVVHYWAAFEKQVFEYRKANQDKSYWIYYERLNSKLLKHQLESKSKGRTIQDFMTGEVKECARRQPNKEIPR